MEPTHYKNGIGPKNFLESLSDGIRGIWHKVSETYKGNENIVINSIYIINYFSKCCM